MRCAAALQYASLERMSGEQCRTCEKAGQAQNVSVASQYKGVEEAAAYERLRMELRSEHPQHLPLLLERVRRLSKLEGDERTPEALQARARAIGAAHSCADKQVAAVQLVACACTTNGVPE